MSGRDRARVRGRTRVPIALLALTLALAMTACSEAQIEAQLRGYVTTFEQGGGEAAAFQAVSDLQMAVGMLLYGI